MIPTRYLLLKRCSLVGNRQRCFATRHLQQQTSSQAVQQTWSRQRERLVQIPVGHLSSKDWMIAKKSLESLDSGCLQAFQLLERLRLENKSSALSGIEQFPITCLHKALGAWREDPGTFDSSSGVVETSVDMLPSSPRELWRMIEKLVESQLFPRDIRTYGILLDIIADNAETLSEAPHLAREILNESILPRAGNNDGVDEFRPNTVIFGTIQKILAKSNITDAHQLAEDLLEQQKRLVSEHPYEDDELKPSQHVYANVIHCWVKSGHPGAGKRAEELLEEVKCTCSEPPHTVVYNLVCRAFVISGMSADKAKALVNEMVQLNAQGHDECVPNELMICAVVEAFANENRLEEAEIFCQEMRNIALPGKSAFTVLIKAWGRRNQPQRSQELFDSLASGTSEEAVDNVALNALLDAWSKSVHKDRVRNVLRLVHQYGSENGTASLFDSVGLNIVIDCISKSAPKKNDELVQTVMDLVKKQEASRSPSQRPNSVTYQSLIMLLCKAGVPEMGAQVMKQLSDDSNGSGVDVSTRHYNAFLSGMVQARRLELKQADALLREMYSLHRNGKDTRPDLTTFNLLLHCCSHSTDSRAPSFAQSLLERLLQISETNQSVCPDIVSYTSVCDCWARSSHPDAPKQAEAILALMQQRLPPAEQSSAVYNAVMTAHARSRQSTPKEVERIFMMGQSILKGRMDFRAYVTLLQCWSKAGEPEKTVAILQDILVRSAAGHLDASPNTQTFNAVLRAWLRSNRDDAGIHIEKGLEEMSELASRFPCQPDTMSYMILLSQFTKDRRSDVGKRAMQILLSQKEKCATVDLRFYAEVMCLVLADQDVTTSETTSLLQLLSREKNLLWEKEGLIAMNRILAVLSRSRLSEEWAEIAESIHTLFSKNNVRGDHQTTRLLQLCRPILADS